MFKYLRDIVKKTRNLGRKPRKWIPLDILIYDILVETKLVAKLEEISFLEDVYTDVGKSFNGNNLKNMLMILDVVGPAALDK